MTENNRNYFPLNNGPQENYPELMKALESKEPQEIAEDLLISTAFGSNSKLTLADLRGISKEELKGRGLSDKEVVTVLSLLELGRRAWQQRLDKDRPVGSKQVSKMMRNRLGDEQQEHLLALYLDCQNRIIKEQVIFKGTVTKSIAEPREILSPAIRHLATAIILVHNHPSGVCTPSPNDDQLTKAMREACELVGIVLLDHIIVSRFESFSYREETDLL